ncbi:hypothetical protein FRC09_005662 [Ceratobasidium sp. 395]|nr:hypothetical protein FRC09_005662 [Ceratobasidium sp. 395]
MPSFALVFFVFLLGLLSVVRALPTSVLPRQFIEGAPVPECALTCALQVTPSDVMCIQTFSVCLSASCTTADFTPASIFTGDYCAGRGIVHTVNGVFVTVVPPVAVPTPTVVDTQPATPTTVIVTEYVTLSETLTETIPELSTTPVEPSTTLFSAASESPSSTAVSTTLTNPLRTPAAISVYIILIFLFAVGSGFYIRHWRRKRQGDFILPTHRSTRGKSFLIDGESFKNTYVPDAIELSDKSQKASGSFEIKLDDRPLPIVPIPTKNTTAGPSTLPRIVTAVTHPPSRSYVALPGRESSPSASASSSPVDVRSPPGLDGSAVSQAFAAGRERAMSVLGQSRGGASPVSPSSSSSSSTPSPSSSSGPSILNTSVYATAARTPVPAYTYQPVAPSPLRAQVGKHRVYSTIVEEPRTPHSATGPSAPAPVPAPSLPPFSFSQLHSTVGTAQRARPAIVLHGRNPRSTENLRQFTFPVRQSLNDTELQITVSEALRDDGLLAEQERSETPSGSMHRGAGGSISSVKERFQALVGGMRRDTRE